MTPAPKKAPELAEASRRTEPLSSVMYRAVAEEWDYIPGGWPAEVAALEKSSESAKSLKARLEAVALRLRTERLPSAGISARPPAVYHGQAMHEILEELDRLIAEASDMPKEEG